MAVLDWLSAAERLFAPARLLDSSMCVLLLPPDGTLCCSGLLQSSPRCPRAAALLMSICAASVPAPLAGCGLCSALSASRCFFFGLVQ